MGGCSQGSQAKLIVETSTSFSDASEAYDFLYESIQKHGRIVYSNGITGSRSQIVERTRVGSYTVEGRLAMHACPLDLDKWLPRILGTAEVANSFTLAESIPTFYVLIDRVGGVFRYDYCYVNRGIFRSAAGPGDSAEELVEMVLEIMAKDENTSSTWPDPAPTIGVTSARLPYLFSEGVLTVNGTAYEIKDFVLAIDNFLQPRWVNSLYPSQICPTDRSVRLRTTHPFTATEFAGLYANASADDGVSATLVFTTGSLSTTFTMAGLQWADTSPTVRGKQEIPLYLDFVARKKGTDNELVVTNASA